MCELGTVASRLHELPPSTVNKTIPESPTTHAVLESTAEIDRNVPAKEAMRYDADHDAPPFVDLRTVPHVPTVIAERGVRVAML